MTKLIPQMTNAERDAKGDDVRDTDPRWADFPEVRVVIAGGIDLISAHGWSYFATLDSGHYIHGDEYISADAARNVCYQRLQQGTWNQPILRWEGQPANIFSVPKGPLPEPTGALKDYLDEWTKRNS